VFALDYALYVQFVVPPGSRSASPLTGLTGKQSGVREVESAI
jgi:hypothetical protein